MEISNVPPTKSGNLIRQDPGKLGIIMLRSIFAVMWFSQGFAKLIYRSDDMYLDNNEFLSQLNYMKVTHPNSFVESILEDFLIPNVGVIVLLVIMTELFIAFSLGLGIFTRLGSMIGGLMTLNLWILTLGWDEWLWTYPLIFFPHIVFFLSRSGRDIGIDRIIVQKTENKFIDLLI